MASTFQIAKTDQGGVRVIKIEGYLDAHTAPQFEDAIQQELEAGNTRIVVDCSGLTYISSAGLGVFMSFIEEIRERGGDIKLACITPKVYQVFEVLGFPALFDIVDTVDAAIAKFSQPSKEDA